ncbi:MAG: sensor histidine kinase [Spirochaetota bacterium]
MRIFDDDLSLFALQRWVAIITGGTALAVGTINLFGRSLLYSVPIFEAMQHEVVLPFFGLALLFFLSGLVESAWIRAIQVSGFAVVGVYRAVAGPGEYMSSAVFVLLSVLLYYEYRGARPLRSWLSVIGGAYATAILVSIVRSAQSAGDEFAVSASLVVLAFLNLGIFTGSLVVLFSLVLYRQHQIRKRYSEGLESMVEEQTAELREAIQQRDTMLQEIHHRVGNSLQLLASFVRLQQETVDEPQRQVLKETELRVHAIADVHATLYRQHQLSHLPLADYASDLLYDMQVAYRGDASMAILVDTAVEAHIDFAVSFGVILNELVTNAAKHGNSSRDPAEVEISITSENDRLNLIVRDHGAGFPIDFRPGVGTEIVDQLVMQNGGTIKRDSSGGASVTVVFPESMVVRHEPVRSERNESI